MIWWFPKLGAPPNHPFIDGISPKITPPFWGTPISGNTHILSIKLLELLQAVRFLAEVNHFVDQGVKNFGASELRRISIFRKFLQLSRGPNGTRVKLSYFHDFGDVRVLFPGIMMFQAFATGN